MRTYPRSPLFKKGPVKEFHYPSEELSICRCAGLSEKGVVQSTNNRYRKLYQLFLKAKQNGMTHKVWLSSGGKNARRSHNQLDGLEIKIDEYFHISGAKLFLPNDPNAPIAQTANCDCDIGFVKATGTVFDEDNRHSRAPLKGLRSTLSFEDVLAHYFWGMGIDVYVKFDAIDISSKLINIHNAYNAVEKAIKPYRMKIGMKPLEIKFVYNHGDVVYGNITYLMRVTLESTQSTWRLRGRLAAFDDQWNFEKRFGEREAWQEALTRGWKLATDSIGKAYSVRFVGDSDVDIHGIW